MDKYREYLEELYDKIKSNPFEITHERDEFSQW